MNKYKHDLKNSLIAIFDLLRIIKNSSSPQQSEEIINKILENEKSILSNLEKS